MGTNSSTKWIGTTMRGVRYREHVERRTKNGKPDRYYVLRYYVDGKRVEEALGWSSDGWSFEKACAILSQLHEGARTGEGSRTLAELRLQGNERRALTNDSVKLMTLSHFFDVYYVPVIQKRKRTWSHDVGRFNKRIRSVLGEYPLVGITATHLESLLLSMRKEGASEATCLQYMAILRQVYNLARVTMVNAKPVYSEQNSPVELIRLPRALVERERFLTYAEADALVDAARDNSDLCDLIVLALNTGLRLGELLRLEWQDVSIENATLIVREEDMRKPGGRVPLNDTALEVFRQRNRMRLRGQQHIFNEERAGKDANIFRRKFRELVESMGLNADSTSARDRVVFHTLRHTFASWLAISGHADIYRIKTLMRHKTIKMTERYAHLLPDATRGAVNNLRPPVLPLSDNVDTF